MESEQAQVNVALMYQVTPMPEAMRAALAGLGVSISYEASASTFDLAALKAAGARAVVISMDSDHDDAFVTVDQMLTEGYSLIFNDTDVSDTLHGHDQARWARHLAAKLHGDPSVMLPLRPAGAEAAATPSLTVAAPVEHVAAAIAPEASLSHSSESTPVAEEILPPQEVPEHPQEFVAESADMAHASDDAALVLSEAPELLSFAHESESDAQAPAEHDLQTPPATSDFKPDDNSWAAFQATDINADPSAHTHHLGDDVIIEPLVFEDSSESDHIHVDLERQDKASALSFASDDDTPFEPIEGTETAAGTEPAPIQRSSDWFQGKNEETLDTGDTASRVADDWALLDFDAEIAPPSVIATPAKEENIAIETSTHASAPDWGLAPLAVEQEAHAGDVGKSVIPRVWALFGSIGSPEALREFLGALPEKLAALLIIVPPIGADFQAALLTQLSKVSPLPIRVVEAAGTASTGEVLLLPGKGRLLVKPDGRLLISAEEGDDATAAESLMRDLVEGFGVRAGIMLLSGTVNGAIAACHHVAEIGGPIWAQQSGSCVISSMVDSANDAGLVQYSAPPRQLAARLAAICATAE